MMNVFQITRERQRQISEESFETAPTEFAVKHENFYWLDLNSFSEHEHTLFRDCFGFHPVAIQDCAEQVHFPKVDDYRDYLYMVLHAVDAKAVAGQVATVELDLFLGENYLISYHEDDIPEIDVLKRDVRDRPLLLQRGPDFLLHAMLERLVVNYFPRLDAFEDRMDRLEERVLDERARDGVLEQMINLKREIVQLKRVIGPQRELFLKLSRPEFPELISEQTMLYFRDVYDQVYRISELVDGYREMLSGLLDAHYAIISYRMNDIIRVLTVFTTILMPLSFVTGIFGMNFEFLPLIHDHIGFGIAMFLMIGIAITMIFFFRHKRWL